MKKCLFAAFSMLMLCSLLVMMTAGTVIAGNPAYSITEYGAMSTKVFDGHWSDPLEWYDGPVLEMDDGSALAVYNIDFGTFMIQWCVEFFDDDTDDEGDYWQIYVDDSNKGGSAPQPVQYRIDIIGHTDLVMYEGDGTGWTEITPMDGEIVWANMIDGSPRNTTPHWILEIGIIKTMRVATNAPPTGMMVAAYDESTDTLVSWPPDADVNNPDTWGLVADFSMDPIPEGLTFAVMAFLSSVSLVVGSHYLQKRSKKREIV